MLSTSISTPSTTSQFLFSLKQYPLINYARNFKIGLNKKSSLLQGHIINIYQNHPSKTLREELEMAVENCFQLSSVCTTRASVLQSYHQFSSAEKIHFPTFRGLDYCKPNLSFTTASSSFAHSFTGRRQKSRLICKAREAVDAVEVVTDANWGQLVVGSKIPVLVEFWAPWCGPCRMIEPVIAELAKEYAGKISCYKLNTDESPNIATQYGIRSIPTMLFFKDGEKKESVIGAVPKSTLAATIDKYVDS